MIPRTEEICSRCNVSIGGYPSGSPRGFGPYKHDHEFQCIARMGELLMELQLEVQTLLAWKNGTQYDIALSPEEDNA